MPVEWALVEYLFFGTGALAFLTFFGAGVVAAGAAGLAGAKFWKRRAEAVPLARTEAEISRVESSLEFIVISRVVSCRCPFRDAASGRRGKVY
jgi:uncharacterized membrane protein